MPNPAASPAVSSTVGLKNMVIAPLTVDTEETLTYGELQLVAGAIEASITRQTGEVEWTAIRRTHDNQYQAVADEDENGFTAAKGATFLQSVYEPVFTTGG